MGTTGTPNIGGMYFALLIIGAGMLGQLVSLIYSLLSLLKLVRREPDLAAGLFYAQVALGWATFAIVATLLVLWQAGASNLHILLPFYLPSLGAAAIVLMVWKVRSSRSKHQEG